MSQDLQRMSNFTGENEVAIHDQEISAIIDQLNRNSDTLDQQTTSTSIAYSTSLTVVAADYVNVGGFLNQQAAIPVPHNLGYYPIVDGYALINGEIYSLPYIQVDSAGDVILEVYIYPTDSGDDVNTAQVSIYSNSATPAMTIYFFCFSVPSTVTQINS